MDIMGKAQHRPRIGIIGFLHETNTFAPQKATYERFLEADAWPGLLVGDELFAAVKGKNLPVAGFVENAPDDWHLIPLLWCSCSPSGPVEEEAYEKIVDCILKLVRQKEPFDALFLDLHGAMVAEHVDDGEGELLRRLRAFIGMDIPIVCSLDFHANVSESMVRMASGLAVYRTYPHVDMAETGARAAFLLSGALENGGSIALMHKFKKPIAMTDQYTEEGTLHAFMNWLKTRDNNSVGMHVEFAAGFPLADVKDCGPALIAYAASELAADNLLKDALQHIMPYISAKPQKLYTVDEAYNQYLKMAANGPVVWADVQDNPGCGGMGNAVGILRYVLARGVDGCLLGVLNCPEIAKKAHETGIGRTIKADWGTYDKPLWVDVTVEALSDGQFSGSGSFYYGCDFDLGLMACVRVDGVRVLVSSKPQQAADRAMFEHLGVMPAEVRLLILKSAVHFRADFSEMATAIFLIKADGMAPADPSELSYRTAFQ